MQTINVQRHEIQKDECNVVVHQAPNAESFIDLVYNEGTNTWEFPSVEQTVH